MNDIEQTEIINLSHTVFQQVHDHNPIGVVAIDKNNNIVYANNWIKQNLGFSKKEFIGSPITCFFTDTSINKDNFQQLSSHRRFQNQEFELGTVTGRELCVLISSVVYCDLDKICYTYLFIKDISSLKKKESLLAYLNKAAEELATARDTQSALDEISRLIVPKFANWFMIDILKNDHLELLTLKHEDPNKVKWAVEYRKSYPTDLNSDQGMARVLKTGIPIFIPVVKEEMITASIKNADQLKSVRMIEIQSIITVAMSNKKAITGVISFISTIAGHYYDETDLRFAQNLANLIGLTLENASLNEGAIHEIAQRKQVEEKLSITQKQLQSALSSGLVGTWVTDLEKDILYADESLCRMYGIPYSPEGCTADAFQQMIHPDDQQKSLKNGLQFMKENRVYETEYRVLNGKNLRWFFARGKTEFNANHKPVLFTGVVIDITGRKLAEMALKESEEKYSAAFFNASVGIVLAGLDGKVITANPAFETITGYTENILKDTHFSFITYPEDLERNEILYSQLYSEQIPHFTLEKRYIHKNGGIIWVRNSISLVHNGLGKPAYAISIIEDITEQKRAQAELKKNEELFRLLAETMPQKVFSTDAAGNLTYLNPRWEQFTGMGMEEIKRVTLTPFIHPDDLEQNLEKWNSALTTGKNFIYEHRFRNKDGQYIWHLTRALPFRDDQGNIIHWIGTMTDINDQKETEKKKDEFISIASHELKTPLTTIKVFFQLLKKEIDTGQKIYQFADKAAKQLSRLERLINDLLDVSKINAGKMQYNPEEFVFNEVLNEAIESVQETTTRHKIILENECNVTLKGDRNRIEQVIINLLNNAVKYSPDADKVIVNCKKQQNNLIVSVKDFGIGIAAEHLGELFERFYRIDNSSNRFQGLGLGLFISSEIVKRHGGTFWIESELNKGSVFYFLLPLEGKQEFKTIDTDNHTYFKGNLIEINYIREKELLDVNWIGYQNYDSVVQGGLLILDFLKKNKAVKLLNDNTHVLGSWSEAADWVSDTLLPQLYKEGLKKIAWIYAPGAFSRMSSQKSVVNMKEPIDIMFFGNRTEATNWINGN